METNAFSHLQTPRREFLTKTTKAVATTTLLSGVTHSLNSSPVHAAGSDSINIALIGCGGRGGGAAADALGIVEAPLKLTALADVAEGRTEMVRRILSRQFPDQVDVPDDRMFMGFDAFKQALDTLRPGDIAIFATPAAFRAAHFEYAISRGLHVFMEKPVAVDGPSAKRIIDLA
ncbi:MAG: Gfo/Idh/MocA family oxidoreductase, partial [Planctomycetaceae bacterium]|nr:Gfo/Idh/MocA family oxidoreductase [Planctomycetaceae bacterium]